MLIKMTSSADHAGEAYGRHFFARALSIADDRLHAGVRTCVQLQGTELFSLIVG